MTRLRHQWNTQKRHCHGQFALVLLLITALAGCGNGTTAPSNAAAPGAQPTSLSGGIITNTSPAPVTTIAPATTIDPDIEAAVRSQIEREITVPYKDIRIEIRNQDDVFATVRVDIQLRKTAASNWELHTADYTVKKVGDQWRVDTAGTFVSPAAEATAVAVTATAHALAARQAYFTSIFMLSPTDGLIVGTLENGDSAFLHYSGGAWEVIPSPKQVSLRNVVMTSPTNGWAAGYTPTNAALLHYHGSQWEPVIIPPNLVVLWDVQMVADNEGWALATGKDTQGKETDTIVHFSGSAWNIVPNPDTISLHSLHMVSATEGWAIGPGSFLHYSGGTWEKIPLPSTVSPGKLYMASASEGWTFGLHGIWHYRDGTWTKSGVWSLTSLSMVASDEGWAVGGEGIIVHYRAGKWEQVASPTHQLLTSVSMTSATDGWAVGEKGTILRYQNGIWHEYRN